MDIKNKLFKFKRAIHRNRELIARVCTITFVVCLLAAVAWGSYEIVQSDRRAAAEANQEVPEGEVIEASKRAPKETKTFTLAADKDGMQLYYNERENRAIAQLTSLLQPTRFAQVREELRKQGFRSGFACLFHGAPGTGKTYLAKKIAESMGCSENEIGFVQFHPSYDYTDFVEGLRPIEKDGNIVFERKDGVFKEFCKKAINYSKPKDIWNNLGEYIKSNIDIDSSARKTKYHIDNYDNKYIYLRGTSIQGYKIPISDVKKAYESKLWEGGQKNGNDSYTAALAKHIYETISSNNSTSNIEITINIIHLLNNYHYA